MIFSREVEYGICRQRLEGGLNHPFSRDHSFTWSSSTVSRIPELASEFGYCYEAAVEVSSSIVSMLSIAAVLVVRSARGEYP